MGTCGRLIALYLEENERYDGPWFILRALRSQNTYLNHKYCSKLAWQVKLFGNHSANFIPKTLTFWFINLLILSQVFVMKSLRANKKG